MYLPTYHLPMHLPTYLPTYLSTNLPNRQRVTHTRAQGGSGGRDQEESREPLGRWDKRAEEGMNEKTKQGGSAFLLRIWLW